MRPLAIFATITIFACACASRPPPKPEDPKEIARVRAQLEKMLVEDQKAVTTDGLESLDVLKRQAESLKGIVTKHGWPTEKRFGKDACEAAWLIVQHADFDVSFQSEMLPLIKAASEKGEIAKHHLPYLTDRVLVNRGAKQLYGTQLQEPNADCFQVPKPIDNEALVEKRRAAFGLPSLDVYLAQARWLCKQQPPSTAQPSTAQPPTTQPQ